MNSRSRRKKRRAADKGLVIYISVSETGFKLLQEALGAEFEKKSESKKYKLNCFAPETKAPDWFDFAEEFIKTSHENK